MSDEPRPLSRSEAASLTALTVKKMRSERGQTIAEGEALVREALASPWLVHEIAATTEWIQSGKLSYLAEQLSKRAVKIRSIDHDLLKRISELETAPGVIATVSPPEQDESHIDGVIIALDRVSDPTNLGAIARTACFYGVKQIWLSEDSVDILNPRAIRASMGGLFHVSTKKCNSLEQELKAAKQQGVSIIAANALSGSPQLPKRPGRAIIVVLGSEAHGIRESILAIADVSWHLLPIGRDLTLNVAATTAILLDRLTSNSS
ncbi:MAG: RNA methyltransferase [bacterium]|nr:RNA methyltransferase [bacterium]